MNDTPRTDERANLDEFVHVDFARQLERELAACGEQLRDLKNNISDERRFQAAKAAMQGLVAHSTISAPWAASLAVKFADALLAELANTNNTNNE